MWPQRCNGKIQGAANGRSRMSEDAYSKTTATGQMGNSGDAECERLCKMTDEETSTI